MRCLLSVVCLCLALGMPVVSGLAETAGTDEPSWVEAGDHEPAQPTKTQDAPTAGDAALTAAHPAKMRRLTVNDRWPSAPMPDSADRMVPVPPSVG